MRDCAGATILSTHRTHWGEEFPADLPMSQPWLCLARSIRSGGARHSRALCSREGNSLPSSASGPLVPLGFPPHSEAHHFQWPPLPGPPLSPEGPRARGTPTGRPPASARSRPGHPPTDGGRKPYPPPGKLPPPGGCQGGGVGREVSRGLSPPLGFLSHRSCLVIHLAIPLCEDGRGPGATEVCLKVSSLSRTPPSEFVRDCAPPPPRQPGLPGGGLGEHSVCLSPYLYG